MKMTNDLLVFSMAEMYCAAKPFWWRMFFGWRCTKYNKKQGCEEYYYKIKNKDWAYILETAENTRLEEIRKRANENLHYQGRK